MLSLKNITKDYQTAGNSVHALRGVSLRFRRNEFVSILGASGCGKTTLLNIIGGLDHYTSGDLVINGVSTKDYKDHDWDVYRNHRIGFVFQSYNLIPHQTVLGNVELALTIAGVSKFERRRRAAEALIKVGLKEELHKRPNQLSGGQMQRVAIARALVNNPEILLADEPTGALDTVTSVQIMELIREIAGERLVIMVTHNPELAEKYSSRIVRLQDGLVISDSNPYAGEEAEDLRARTVRCPHCGAILRAKGEKGLKEGEYPCPNCAQKFALKKRTGKDNLLEEDIIGTPVDKKKEKNNKKAKREGKKKRREKSSMSFATSLGLSARNLLTKKGRTAITSVAGSIGIISVCLVLALSNGFNNYILQTEEDMLSFYPVQITRTSMDMTSIMSNINSATDMPQLDKIGDKVYVNSLMSNIAKGMVVTNDLSDEYTDYLESMDESLYEAILYGYGMSTADKIFTSVETGGTEKNPQKTTRYMSLENLKQFYKDELTTAEPQYAQVSYLVDYLGSIVSKMPGTSDFSDPRYGQYVLSQYDVIEGEFPSASDEAVMVIGGNNDASDFTLAQLGYIAESDFLSLFEKSEEIENAGGMMIPFDEIINKEFILYNTDAVYKKLTPSDEDYARYDYKYEGERTSLSVAEGEGTKIKIKGILRLKKGLTYGCLNGGLNLTEKLIEEYIQTNMNSQMAQTIRNEYIPIGENIREMVGLPEGMNVYSRCLMEGMDEYYRQIPNFGWLLFNETGAMQKIGASKVVDSISLYTSTFETKAQLLSHLNEWNERYGGEDATEEMRAKQVHYTDAVGTMMTMVSTILDAITYVLVAFTAISLVVSSVMIGIITYVSVVERTKEIGVLRSLGARKKDVKNLFNAETFIIGLTSGVFGVGVTYLLSFGINALLAFLTGIATLASLPISSAIVMVCISITLTLISGLIPAQAAAKKDPVIALRTE